MNADEMDKLYRVWSRYKWPDITTQSTSNTVSGEWTTTAPYTVSGGWTTTAPYTVSEEWITTAGTTTNQTYFNARNVIEYSDDPFKLIVKDGKIELFMKKCNDDEMCKREEDIEIDIEKFIDESIEEAGNF